MLGLSQYVGTGPTMSVGPNLVSYLRYACPSMKITLYLYIYIYIYIFSFKKKKKKKS